MGPSSWMSLRSWPTAGASVQSRRIRRRNALELFKPLKPLFCTKHVLPSDLVGLSLIFYSIRFTVFTR